MRVLSTIACLAAVSLVSAAPAAVRRQTASTTIAAAAALPPLATEAVGTSPPVASAPLEVPGPVTTAPSTLEAPVIDTIPTTTAELPMGPATTTAAAVSGQQLSQVETPPTTTPINAPQVVIANADAMSVGPRQVVLNAIVSTALAQYNASPADVSDTLEALMTAYNAYTTASPSVAAAGDSTASTAATNLYAAVLAHVATPEGSQMVQTLAATNSAYAAADQAASVNRADECEQLQTYFSGSLGSINPQTKQCMCDNTQSYSYCRMLLANDMHTSTSTVASSGTPGSVASFASTFASGGAPSYDNDQLDLGSTWQPSAYASSSSSNSTADTMGFNGYNPLTGEISAGFCLGEGFELCLKGGGYLPSFKTVVNSVSGATVTEIETCAQGSCSSTPVADFAASAASQLTSADIEVSVSLCLGLPGLTDVLNEWGISLCFNLLVADFYPFQGPLGELSTGLNLWIVKFGAWGKLKLANGAPVCPQDFNADMMAYSCAHQDVYQSFISQFGGDDFCNLSQGQGLVGASITVDLWFWSKEWDWSQTPTPRAPQQC